MIIRLKILEGLSRMIVSDRHLRASYKTNRAVKYYGFYCILKSMTTSGLVRDYVNQLTHICEITKRSRSTFYSYLNECIKLGLIEKVGDNLRLTSWDTLVERFALRERKFTEFNYDTTRKDQTPEYFLISAEISENQQYQVKSVMLRIGQNPQIKHFITKEQSPAETVKSLQNMQVQTFFDGCGGSEIMYSIIHSFNADTQRTVPKLRKAFNLKSNRSVAYLKRQLSERGFAEVTQRFLKSSVRMRKDKNIYCTGWDRKLGQSTWHLPDMITLLVS